VEVFPFDDHNAPQFDLIQKFCQNVEAWLAQSDQNIAVVHCKAGKGRTGLMICSWLLYNKEWTDPNDAMNFYAAMRTYNMKGVTIPSQIRYIKYFGIARLNGIPEMKTLYLNKLTFFKYPKISSSSGLRAITLIGSFLLTFFFFSLSLSLSLLFRPEVYHLLVQNANLPFQGFFFFLNPLSFHLHQ